MKKYLSFLAFILFSVMISSCDQDTDADIHKDDTKARAIAATYYGTVPCADCMGIELKLDLNEDYTYQASYLYQGKTEQPEKERGTYGFVDDRIVALEKDEPRFKYYKIENGGLRLLDTNMEEINGSLKDQYLLAKDVENGSEGSPINVGQEYKTGKEIDFLKNKWDAGIEFYAEGENPDWTLNMDFDKDYRLSVEGGSSGSSQAVEPEADETSRHFIYRSGEGIGSMVVHIIAESCIDNVAKRKALFTVRVDLMTSEGETQTVEGCGYYIPNPDLHGKWEAVSVQGVPLINTDFQKGLPNLELSIDEYRIAGHDGCNEFSGSIYSYGDVISIGMVTNTKMACSNLEKSQKVLDFFAGQTLTYLIDGEELRLRNQDDALFLLKSRQ